MTRLRAAASLFVLIALAAPLASGAADFLPQTIVPANPNIRYVGRFTSDYRSAWPNSTVEMAFTGTAVNALLSGNHVYYVSVVDSDAPKKFKVVSGQEVYRLADGLKRGNHVVRLVRVNESFFNPVQFKGFQLESKGRLAKLPTPPKRTIEVIGDSISAGYGNESAKPEDGFDASTENSYMTYGPIAARSLKADCVLMAWSGKGLYRNRGAGDRTADAMPTLYDRIIAMDANSRWDFKKHIPDVVVVNLGTNDWDGGAPPLDKFAEAGADLVTKIRKHAPKAHVFFAAGPMLNGKALTDVKSCVDQMVAKLSDRKIHYLDFGGLMKWPVECGGHYHPNVASHEKMAKKLVDEIRTILRW